MKISKLIGILKKVKNQEGDKKIGIKVAAGSMLHIVEIEGVSVSGFEGINITNEDI